jgi:DNA polymerase I-like protein with 3'-5' exonuclease and polymerase domains
MYLDPQKNLGAYEVFDIETDGLDPTRVWCAVFKNMGTGLKTSCLDHHSIREYINARPHTTWVGHNSIPFDGPVIDRLCDAHIDISRHVDTCVLSYLYNPKLQGGHGLAAYGERFGFPKVVHEDWTQFSPHMLERCQGDVDLTEMVFLALSKRMTEIGYSEKSCELEHHIRRIIDVQERNGFGFDVPRARDLRGLLRDRQADLALEIREAFPPSLEEMGHYKNKKRKDGSDYALLGKHLAKYDLLKFNEDETEYTTYSRTPFNIGSPQQRVQRLLEAGWKPESFTPRGAPKVDEVALLDFAEASRRVDIALMADWVVLEGRSTMVEGWLDLVKEDGRIHGKVFSCGARSRRMTHSKPNSANIPSESNGAKYGRECRELWVAEEGKVLVGYDGKSMQMRGLCHFIGKFADNTELIKRYCEGDPHQANADLLTVELGVKVSRGGGGAKTLYYGTVFGGGTSKLASIIGSTNPRKGKVVQDAYYKITPGLREAVEAARDEFDRNDGRLKCIDGGFVICPARHASLNYQVQPFEAVVMKQVAIYVDERTREKGLNHRLVGTIHDEAQHELDPKDAQAFGELACQAITDAGETFNLNCPLAGTSAIGQNWSQTH